MNKFLHILNIALLSCLILPNIYSGKLTIAINRLDKAEVERLLEKRGLTQEQKNKLLSVAKESIRNRGIATYGLAKSKRDILRIIFGSGSILAGGLASVIGAQRILNDLMKRKAFLMDQYQYQEYANYKKDFAIDSGITTLGVGLIANGVTQIYRGWKLRSAYLNVKKAYKIKDLITNYPVKTSQNI